MAQPFEPDHVVPVEQAFHTEIYPGTEVMVDTDSHSFVKTRTGNHSVLVPQPTDNENDPLNWSAFWKAMAITCATLVSFTQGLGPLALAPMFGDYIKAFDSNLSDVVQFTGVAILVLGFSNFLWVPLMMCFGRRPTVIVSSLLCLASAIWRARATTYGSFMGACVLNGIASGPAETAQPAIIADIMFLHERGSYNTLYFASYFGSLMVGPIISGAMAEKYGWRNFWWFYVALCAFTGVCCILLFPETKYDRPEGSQHQKTTTPLGSERHVSNELTSIVLGDVNSSNIENGSQTTSIHTANSASHMRNGLFLGRGKPSKQQWKLWQPYEGNICSEFFLPIHLHIFPIVELAAFNVSFSASTFLTLNLTQSQVFAAPPYSFSSQTIGFFNFATLTGTIIGLVTAGPLSDWIAAKLTMKNKGIREPEMRLLTAIPYVIIMIIGNVVVSMGYHNFWDWKIVVMIGYTCGGIQVAALPSIFSTYAVDSYRPVAGALFVAITVNKNLYGYGVSKYITPWSIKAGFLPPIMTHMALGTLWCLFGILFWYKGKYFRKLTRKSKVHSM